MHSQAPIGLESLRQNQGERWETSQQIDLERRRFADSLLIELVVRASRFCSGARTSTPIVRRLAYPRSPPLRAIFPVRYSYTADAMRQRTSLPASRFEESADPDRMTEFRAKSHILESDSAASSTRI